MYPSEYSKYDDEEYGYYFNKYSTRSYRPFGSQYKFKNVDEAKDELKNYPYLYSDINRNLFYMVCEALLDDEFMVYQILDKIMNRGIINERKDEPAKYYLPYQGEVLTGQTC